MWRACVLINAVVLGDDPDALLAAIRNAYEANRAVLTFGFARFDWSVGQADDVDDAVDGRWSRRFVAQGLYAYDGRYARFEQVFPVEAMVADRRRSGPSTYETGPTFSFRVLTNGNSTLWDGIHVAHDDKTVGHSSQIHPGSEIFFQFASFPLGLGMPDPSFHFPAELDSVAHPSGGWTSVKLHPHASLNDAPRPSVTFSAGKRQMTYRFDLERGAVPVQIVGTEEDGDPWIHIVFDDLQHVANKAWLPFRQTVFFPSDGQAKALLITQADFEHHPEKSVFRLEFPTPSRMIDTVRNLRYPDTQAVFDLDNLPVSAAGTQHITIRRGPAASLPALSGERTAKRWWPHIAVATGIVLLIVVLSWRRYRRAYT